METGDRWRLGHRPALDGLRGVAVLLVLACHANLPGLYGAGAAGVSVFFTLSGFLITTLLLEEHARTGQVVLRRFYARRARRLFPALAASVVAVAVIGPLVGGWFFSWRFLAPVLAYMGNWVNAFGGSIGGFSGTWSLAVEEQFYLLWPLVALACLRRGPRTVAWVAGLGVAASLAARVIEWHQGFERLYYGSDTSAVGLLLGCLLAAVLHMTPVREVRPALAIAGLVGVGAFCLMGSDLAAWGIAPVAVPQLTLLVLYGTSRGRAGGDWLARPWLVWCGRRSYGLYLWNCPVNVYLNTAHPGLPWWLHAALLLGATFPLAVLSWRFVESPFQRIQRGAGSAHAARPAKELVGQRVLGAGAPRGRNEADVRWRDGLGHGAVLAPADTV